jgi:hypothetical protein
MFVSTANFRFIKLRFWTFTAFIFGSLGGPLFLLFGFNIAYGAAGEVSLAIGYAEIHQAGSQSKVVKKGMFVEEGDEIRTSQNGHVHVRFIDGALVSVRPNSSFSVQVFKYNPSNPSDSTVRFSMSHGEVRSVSGAVAKEARERFRLNTPIVAIGVRGTDFLAVASPEVTVATVNQGAIIMTPFDSNCRPDWLVGCNGQRSRLLSADMTGLALVYRVGGFDPGYQTMQGQRERTESGSTNPVQDAVKQNVDRAVDAKRAGNPEEIVAPSKLVWGRWLSAPAPGDLLTVTFREAMSGNKVTVGDGYFFLFRTPETVNLLPSLKTQADFKLTSAAAFHRLSSGEQAAAFIDSGRFSVDFARRSYVTQLNVSATGVPNHQVEFRGTVDPVNGIFLGKDASLGSRLAGALALDGKQAGYSFNVPVGFGSLQGATLWGR